MSDVRVTAKRFHDAAAEAAVWLGQAIDDGSINFETIAPRHLNSLRYLLQESRDCSGGTAEYELSFDILTQPLQDVGYEDAGQREKMIRLRITCFLAIISSGASGALIDHEHAIARDLLAFLVGIVGRAEAAPLPESVATHANAEIQPE